LRLAEQEASASHSAHPCSRSSRPASELSHCPISAEGFHHTGCARPEATTPHSPRARSGSPRCSRASPQKQVHQENHLHIDRNTSDAHEQVRCTLDTDTFCKGQEEPEQQCQERQREVARGAEAVHDTLPPGSPASPDTNGDAQAVEARELIKQARANATTARAALRPSPVAGQHVHLQLICSPLLWNQRSSHLFSLEIALFCPSLYCATADPDQLTRWPQNYS
jgi:hypothetical protein